MKTGNFESEIEKYKLIQKCPKCNSLELTFARGALHCGNCGFEQKVPSIE